MHQSSFYNITNYKLLTINTILMNNAALAEQLINRCQHVVTAEEDIYLELEDVIDFIDILMPKPSIDE